VIKAVIFDFDGTILDTETPDYESWRAIFQDYGHHLDLATWSQCVGTDYTVFDPFEKLDTLAGRRSTGKRFMHVTVIM